MFTALSKPGYRDNVCRKLILVCITMFVAGCATTEVESYQRVPDSLAEQAYIKPGVNFKSYKRLYPMRLEIYYAEGAGAPTAADLERIRAIFRTAFLEALAGDYTIASKPAPDALTVRASLVDLQTASRTTDLHLGEKLTNLVGTGRLTFFMELSDSMTGEVLARAADPDKSGDGDPVSIPGEPLPAATDPASWARVEAAAARWAGMFRAFLDESFGG